MCSWTWGPRGPGTRSARTLDAENRGLNDEPLRPESGTGRREPTRIRVRTRERKGPERATPTPVTGCAEGGPAGAWPPPAPPHAPRGLGRPCPAAWTLALQEAGHRGEQGSGFTGAFPACDRREARDRDNLSPVTGRRTAVPVCAPTPLRAELVEPCRAALEPPVSRSTWGDCALWGAPAAGHGRGPGPAVTWGLCAFPEGDFAPERPAPRSPSHL